MRYVTKPLSVLAIIAALAPQTAAGAATTIKIGAWAGGAIIKDKRTAYCQAETASATQTAIGYRVTPTYTWQLLMRNATWRFTNGSKLPITLRLNDRDTLHTSAIVRDNHILDIELSDTVNAFDRLRGAKSLQVRMGGLAVDFDLTGSGEVLGALTDCVRRSVPFAAGQPRSGTAKTALNPEAAMLGTTTFQFAETSGMAATQDTVPGVLADAAWRSGPVIATIAVEAASRDADAAVGAALATAHRACKVGRFFAVAAPDRVDRLKIARGLAVCQTMENTIAVYYLAAPRAKGGEYLIGISTNGADYGLFGRQPAGDMIGRFKLSIANALAQIQTREKAHAQQ